MTSRPFMSEKECDFCGHWVDITGEYGQCRRNSPVPQYVPGTLTSPDTDVSHPVVHWPLTYYLEVCGDWVRRPLWEFMCRWLGHRWMSTMEFLP